MDMLRSNLELDCHTTYAELYRVTNKDSKSEKRIVFGIL